MGGKTISTSATKIEALQLQSSAYGVTIPLLYGLTRVPGNLVWYGGFKAIPITTSNGSGGKGGGVKTQNTTYDYKASVMMGVCAGVITGIPRVWKGKQIYGGGIPPSTIFNATENYTVGSPYTYTPAHTVRSVVSVAGTYGTGENSGYTVLAEGNQYHFDGTKFIFDPSLNGSTFAISYQYVSGSTSQDALTQLGLSFIDGHLGQMPWGPLSTIAPTQVLGYSGLALVAGQDYELGTGAQVENHTFEVQGPLAYSISNTIPDVDAADFIADVIVNSFRGAAFPADRLSSLAAYSNYCRSSGLLFSPLLDTQGKAADVVQQCCDLTNSGPVWSGDRLKIIPYGETSLTGNGRTYTPNNTPIYDLTDDHFLDKENPIAVEQKNPADRYNHVRIQWLDRGAFNASTGTYDGNYAITIAEAKDQTDIDLNGLRSAPVTQAHWICDAQVAKNVCQLALQRALHIVNTYTFRLPWCFDMLEPMDLVTITDPDPNVNINKLVVRITSATEDGTGEITIEAEDWPGTIATATAYPNVGGLGFTHDYNVDPGNVTTPFIFEAPGFLTDTTGLQVLAAATGASVNWGGCNVWVSLDGVEYVRVDTIYGGSRYGTLTGPIVAGSVPVAINGGQLLNGSILDSTLLTTLCYIGGATPEFFGYQYATLTGSEQYTLTGLSRGAYNSFITSHAASDSFVRLDDSIAASDSLDPSYIGKTIYLKFTSFNVYGLAEQSLASVPAYTYVPTGLWVASNVTYGQASRISNMANITVFGSTAEKTSGSNVAWDAGWVSAAAFANGAFVSGVTPQTNRYQMIGLSQVQSVNYANADFLIHVDISGGLYYVYEMGALITTLTAYSAFDSFSVQYDGLWAYYLRNGVPFLQRPALPGLKLYAIGLHYSLGGVWQNIRFGPLSNLHQPRGSNLIDASWWAVGKSPTSGTPSWPPNNTGTTGGSDSFVIAAGPDGPYQPLWQAIAGSPDSLYGSGGWNPTTDPTNSFAIDRTKTYMFACYMQQPSVASGSLYWGIDGNSVVDDLNTTTVDTNPYFASGTVPAGRWYLFIGWVFPQGSTGNSNGAAGIYDCTTGQRVATGTCYNWHAGVTRASTRAYQYYSVHGNVALFAAPQVYLCDGSEPTLQDLITITGTPQIAVSAATDIVESDHDFAGTDTGGGTGTSTWGSFTVTPLVDSFIEFTASLVTSGVDGDSGNRCGWQVNDGTTTTNLGSIGSTGTKISTATVATIAAVGGVALTFSVVTQRLSGGNPHMFLYQSNMRATVVKR